MEAILLHRTPSSSKYIKDFGALLLAHHYSITDLSVASNAIGTEGAKELAMTTTLTTLNISGNSAEDDGNCVLSCSQ